MSTAWAAERSDVPGADLQAAVLEQLPGATVVLDEQLRILWASAGIEAALGVPQHLAAGRSWGELIHCHMLVQEGARCGEDAECQRCPTRVLARQVANGLEVPRQRYRLGVAIDRRYVEREVQLRATFVTFEGRHLPVLRLERIDPAPSPRPPVGSPQTQLGMVGQHPRMLELFAAIRAMAPSDAPVLIHGESGTGKELVARAIHEASARRTRLLVPVNCGAIPEGLVESELFGHVKGAFTGALGDRKGRFELADGGTLFLDEIGELSPTVQVKLLRVLEDGAIERVGGERAIRVDTRVVCATHRDLQAEVARGRFRADLYYRLAALPVEVPPLRARGADLELLCDHYLELHAIQRGRPRQVLGAEALATLRAFPWPGNVRELENALCYALVKAGAGVIEPEHLPERVRRRWDAPTPFAVRHPLKLERERVAESLRACKGNKTEAARLLGVGRATLYRYLERQS